MKKIAFIIILLFITLAMQLQAQTPLLTYQDTARYLMNEIEAKKNLYIGKPFSVLYDSLKIKPVNHVASVASKTGFGEMLRIYFNNEREFEKTHMLILDFESVPPYNILYPVFFPSPEQRGSIDSVVQAYKPLIVKDVVTKDYYEEPDWEPAIHANTSVENNPAITAQLQAVTANISNNQKYANQPFSVLWNDLSIKPKTILGKTGSNPANEQYSTFFFQPPDSLSITYIWVTWKGAGIPKTETQQYQLSAIRDFTEPQEYAIYANKIMDDVIIRPFSLYPGGIPSPFSVPQPPAVEAGKSKNNAPGHIKTGKK